MLFAQSVEGRVAWAMHMATVRLAVGEPAEAEALARDALALLYGGRGGIVPGGPNGDLSVLDVPRSQRRLAATSLYNLSVFQVPLTQIVWSHQF